MAYTSGNPVRSSSQCRVACCRYCRCRCPHRPPLPLPTGGVPLRWGSIRWPLRMTGTQCALNLEAAYPSRGLSCNKLLCMSAVLPFSDSMAMTCAGVQAARHASAPGACATTTWPGQTFVSLPLHPCKLIADSPFAPPPRDFPIDSNGR